MTPHEWEGSPALVAGQLAREVERLRTTQMKDNHTPLHLRSLRRSVKKQQPPKYEMRLILVVIDVLVVTELSDCFSTSLKIL